MKRFWETEDIGMPKKEIMSKGDEEVLNLTRKTFKMSSDGRRYQVRIPWKENRNQLPNNFPMAFKRLVDTEKQLERKPHVKKLYHQNIKNYEEKGYIRKLHKNEISETKWFLPHFPVVKFDKTTSKVRMVMDAAAKYDGMCLNETINQGPKLQNDLVDVLLRFRKNKIAITCDIEEMYLQIEMETKDRAYHRFLWRNSDEEIQVFEFNRIVFGVNSSPFLANFINRQNALKYSNKLPRAVETILSSTYMYDSMDSMRNDEDDNGLLRCDSRLKYATYLPYDVKHPIELPRKNAVTRLIIQHYHNQAHHEGGTNHTITALSAKYWIICGREAIREFETSCMECKKRKAKAASQIMAPLPPSRLLVTLKAFDKVGLDYGGPFLTKQGRGKVRIKRYLCLFTCLATRAEHLEMEFNLTTSSFLNAFWRMTYRRGLPTYINSDNGTPPPSRLLTEHISMLMYG